MRQTTLIKSSEVRRLLSPTRNFAARLRPRASRASSNRRGKIICNSSKVVISDRACDCYDLQFTYPLVMNRNNPPLSPPKFHPKVASLRQQIVATEKKVDAAKKLAREAKAALKQARKDFKLAKWAAKAERKKLKSWKKMLAAATARVSPAESPKLRAKTKAKPAKKKAAKASRSQSARRARISRVVRSLHTELPSQALSLSEQYSAGSTLGAAAIPPSPPSETPAPPIDNPPTDSQSGS